MFIICILFKYAILATVIDTTRYNGIKNILLRNAIKYAYLKILALVLDQLILFDKEY